MGRSFGKTSAESFEIANYLICDAPYSTGRDEEEEEDTFNCLKSPETSGGCWYRSVPLWHQALNLVSKPLWVCKSTKVRIFFPTKSTKSYLECSSFLYIPKKSQGWFYYDCSTLPPDIFEFVKTLMGMKVILIFFLQTKKNHSLVWVSTFQQID